MVYLRLPNSAAESWRPFVEVINKEVKRASGARRGDCGTRSKVTQKGSGGSR
jgi:hypothetical protein